MNAISKSLAIQNEVNRAELLAERLENADLKRELLIDLDATKEAAIASTFGLELAVVASSARSKCAVEAKLIGVGIGEIFTETKLHPQQFCELSYFELAEAFRSSQCNTPCWQCLIYLGLSAVFHRLVILNQPEKREPELPIAIAPVPTDPWVEIRDEYIKENPRATARQVAGEIFRQMDGKEQSERLQEFAMTTEYSGKKYRTQKEAAIAKIKKKLERLD